MDENTQTTAYRMNVTLFYFTLFIPRIVMQQLQLKPNKCHIIVILIS